RRIAFGGVVRRLAVAEFGAQPPDQSGGSAARSPRTPALSSGFERYRLRRRDRIRSAGFIAETQAAVARRDGSSQRRSDRARERYRPPGIGSPGSAKEPAGRQRLTSPADRGPAPALEKT